MKKIFGMICLACAFLGACKKEKTTNIPATTADLAESDTLPINHFQFLGSHNSYRKATDKDIYNFLLGIQNILPSDLNPEELDYSHIPLEDQLSNYPIRGFELDIYHDPTGGRFYNRQGNALVFKPTASNEPDLLFPGMKVLHIPDVDYNTSHLTFKSALQKIKQWSNAHPKHIPLFILVEAKETSIAEALPGLNFTHVLPYTQGALDSLDNEVREVFSDAMDKIFKPDDLRKEHTSMIEAIQKKGWPSLKSMRGKIVFIIMGSDQTKQNYLAGHEALAGRLMFMFSEAGKPETAFIKIDDSYPVEPIQDLVRQGYIVRTRADAGTHEAREGNYQTFFHALESGAQIISTDYYRPDTRWSPYFVAFPQNEIARLNPVKNSPSIPYMPVKE